MKSNGRTLRLVNSFKAHEEVNTIFMGTGNGLISPPLLSRARPVGSVRGDEAI
jgi:hypothetical protein